MHKPLRLSILAAALAVSALFVTSFAASGATTINPANAPTGTHFAGKTGQPTCLVDGNTVTCGTGTDATGSYQLAGVGNNDASATLSATYTATVVCINGGGNPSDSQHQGSFNTTTGTPVLHPKNGRLAVPSLASDTPTDSEFLAQQSCPNPNWTPTIPDGVSLQSFTYTLSFAGFNGAFITITGP